MPEEHDTHDTHDTTTDHERDISLAGSGLQHVPELRLSGLYLLRPLTHSLSVARLGPSCLGEHNDRREGSNLFSTSGSALGVRHANECGDTA